LELTDRETGATVQLEANRIPTIHSGDVLRAFREESRKAT
jgi:hypothetical protein